MNNLINKLLFNNKKGLEINLRAFFYVLAALITAGIVGFIILNAINRILR